MIPLIIGVAIKLQNGDIYQLPSPFRHNHVFLLMKERGVSRENSIRSTQGFMDSDGIFLTRGEAYDRSIMTGQYNRKNDSQLKELFSEDLW